MSKPDMRINTLVIERNTQEFYHVAHLEFHLQTPIKTFLCTRLRNRAWQGDSRVRASGSIERNRQSI